MMFFRSAPPPPAPQEVEYREATEDRGKAKRERLQKLGQALKLNTEAGRLLSELAESVLADEHADQDPEPDPDPKK